MGQKILVLSRFYWPDEVAVAQLLTDLTIYLNNRNVNITVYCSDHAYEKTKNNYPLNENLNGIEIKRIKHFSFGKQNFIGRILDIISFNLILFLRLLRLKKNEFNVILGLTNPPLISFIGVLVAKWKKIPFHFWAMDLQPEMSFRIGYLKRNAPASKILSWMNQYIYKNADHIIALDRFMQHFIYQIAGAKNISTIPVWPTNQEEAKRSKSENDFIKLHQLEGKTVVMYSGNHSIAHPLATLLKAAKALKSHPIFHFVFIGEGIRKKEVETYKQEHELDNLLLLPLQPRNTIHISLSAADLQVVVIGNDLVGLTHPSKIYSAMNLAIPILYIGPQPSHVSEILNQTEGNIIINHEQDTQLIKALLEFSKLSEKEKELIGQKNKELIEQQFSASKTLSLFEKKLL